MGKRHTNSDPLAVLKDNIIAKAVPPTDHFKTRRVANGSALMVSITPFISISEKFDWMSP
jgi:hypothetical protein